MKLYVMRHGPAEDSSPTGRDGDRALTPDGRNRTRAVARAVSDDGENPLSIISSPLVRALQTAEIVAAETNLAKRVEDAKGAGGSTGAVEIRREMAPGGDTLGLIRELARAGRKRVLVVGHEPDLSMLVLQLIGRHLDQGMLKSMVVGIKVDLPPGGEVESERRVGSSRSGQTSELTTAFRFILDPKTLAWQRA